MRHIALLLSLMLVGCTNGAYTPEQSFYAVVSSYHIVLKAANEYDAECKVQKLPNDCIAKSKGFWAIESKVHDAYKAASLQLTSGDSYDITQFKALSAGFAVAVRELVTYAEEKLK